MKIERLQELLDKGIFNEEEAIHAKRVLKELPLGEKNIGIPDFVRFKYYMGFDATNIVGDEFKEEFLKQCSPPPGIENYNTLFRKYGHTIYGLTTDWEWYREDTLTLSMNKRGMTPIEEATEEECWRMLAISAFYWQRFYEEKYGKGE